MAGSPSITRLVCMNELRLLLRDRRAFLLAIVLPMLLFPLLFYGMDSLKVSSQESQQSTLLRVGLDLTNMNPRAREEVLEVLNPEDLRLTTFEVERTQLGRFDPWTEDTGDQDADAWYPAEEGVAQWSARTHGLEPVEWREELEGLLEEADLVIVARNNLRNDGRFSQRFTGLHLIYNGSDTKSNEAQRRVSTALLELREELMIFATVEALSADPGGPVEMQSTDLATLESSAGHRLGAMLPIILIMIVISSASFAALGAFAGEREEGTIETLLVQPVPADAVARGKFLAVLLVACAAALGNGLSFLISILLGLGASSSELELGQISLRVGLGLVQFLPTAVFLSALLTLISARAKSFREGQHYVLPIVLVASLLASVSTQDSIPANLVFALIPISGPTLVLRDTLAGQLPWLPAIVSFLASSAWSWLLLKRLAETLDAERIFKSRQTPAEAAGHQAQARRALRYGFISIVLIYIVGGRLQTAALIPGLLATLWILVPALAILCARGVARSSGESLAKTLGLVAVSPLHLLGALLISPALVVLLRGLLAWQSSFLPFPADLAVPSALLELSPWMLVGVLALTPGITEELLFRGAILAGLKKELPTGKVVAWQALLFGAVHASIYRFLATGLLGGCFAILTLRTRCLWPAMLAHASYNAINVLDLPERPEWHPGLALALGAVGCALIWRTPARARTDVQSRE